MSTNGYIEYSGFSVYKEHLDMEEKATRTQLFLGQRCMVKILKPSSRSVERKEQDEEEESQEQKKKG